MNGAFVVMEYPPYSLLWLKNIRNFLTNIAKHSCPIAANYYYKALPLWCLQESWVGV